MRSHSGVTPITIFTKPFACGGACVYCPKVDGIPQSYLPRVNINKANLSYSSEEQMNYWLSYIQSRGGIGDKLEIIVMGGSFTAYPLNYIEEFIAGIYNAIEKKGKMETKDLISFHANSKSKRIIGITVETRPDLLTEDLVGYLFSLGVTKIELGVQSLDDNVLILNKRGHNVNAVKTASNLIKNKGLKVGYHLLFGMPGSTMASDINTVWSVCTNPDYQPDHLKLYFCEMFRSAFMKKELIALYENNQWAPFNYEERICILKNVCELIPAFMRISRIGRKASMADLEISRPNIDRTFYEREYGCRCIRCREPKDRHVKFAGKISVIQISINDIFIEALADDDVTCLGIVRLRLRKPDVCLIRELHVYGQEVKRGEKGHVQHRGLGSFLIEFAEQTARDRWHVQKMAIGSGVGVRTYFRKADYELREDSLMWKDFGGKAYRTVMDTSKVTFPDYSLSLANYYNNF